MNQQPLTYPPVALPHARRQPPAQDRAKDAPPLSQKNLVRASLLRVPAGPDKR